MTAEIACRIDAIEDRRVAIDVARGCFDRVETIEEREHGWALRFAGDAETLRRVVEYVSIERRCCPFFVWTLTIAAEGGSAWLAVTGPEGAKALLRAGLERSDLIPERVAREAGWSVGERAVVDEGSIEGLVEAMNLRARG